MKKISLLVISVLMTGLVGCSDYEEPIKETKQVEKKVETVEKEDEKKDVYERQEDPDTLTIENVEFKRILTEEVNDDEVKNYFDNNTWNMVEFDCYVSLFQKWRDYDTRYEMIIRPGDYNIDSYIGPYFKIENVGSNQLNGLLGLLKEGTNIHVKAQIIKYNENNGLIELRLENIEVR